jgi:glucose-6-phosphate isomerase
MQHDIRNTRAWPLLGELKPAFDETPRECHAASLSLDLTTAGMNTKIVDHLLMLAEELNWSQARDDLFSGQTVNASEHHAALHTAMRALPDQIPPAVRADVKACHNKMNAALARIDLIRPVDIIHVGIGGSGLGPQFLLDYLETSIPGKYRMHVISNADPEALARIQAKCDPLRTVLIIVSKSFQTEDVMLVAKQLAAWLKEPKRIFAVTGQTKLAEDFGIEKDQIVPMAPWLGGRFSIWGGVALPILLNFGGPVFEKFLLGARQMDEHFLSALPQQNMPLQFALAHVWQRDFMRCAGRAIIPYTNALQYLPAYVQQLEMESNGKTGSVPTAPIIFGGVGTTVQHSFMQWLHQGPGFASTDFILPLRTDGAPELAEFMRNNALAQSAALAHGAPPEFVGGRPSNLIFMDSLSPAALGALIALYEHKVYLEAHFWGINCFDQPGVELGKRLARDITAGKIPRSTSARLGRYK